ncbi:Heavy metal-associated domain HMA [Arabidopsis suecica]|uniref:Heavy metal-associated domain HMA n=2 Tax=Arabidopsis suecica TaxID=45249 RepID=A0A8T2BMC0_ARASU|nr:Heavy metal-associated domain HMA [Arabidopsis suecica]
MATEEMKPDTKKTEQKQKQSSQIKEDLPPPIKSCSLKVSIHCEGCKKKVKKILTSIEGVYIVYIDVKQHKVTVIGIVSPEILLKKLIKAGKNAVLLPEIPDPVENKPKPVDPKEKNKKKKKGENLQRTDEATSSGTDKPEKTEVGKSDKLESEKNDAGECCTGDGCEVASVKEKKDVLKEKDSVKEKKKKKKMKTKKLGEYNNKQKILLVGEGDFSFSLSLARAFGSATNLTATSLDTLEEIQLKYKNGKANVEELKTRGCTVVHGINVHSMAKDRKLGQRSELYDRIIFNFPHSGFGFGCENQSYYIMLHQAVVRGFMKNAKKIVKDVGGEIHVTHKTAHPFNEWKIETLAEEKGLCLIREIEFNKFCFPGYSNKRGSGRRCDSSFPVGKSSTFMFQKRIV